MVNELLRMGTNPGRTFGKIMKAETGKVLELSSKWTGAAKAGATPRNRAGTGFHEEGESELWINTTGRNGSPIGRAWLREPNAEGVTKTYMVRGPGANWRWSNERWQRGQRMIPLAGGERTASRGRGNRIKGRGLAKRSWLQCANDLGITIRVPAYVRRALPQDGRDRRSGFGREMNGRSNVYFEIENRYPLLLGGNPSPKFNGAAILQRAIKTRRRAFEGDLRRGVFSNIRLRAQRYADVFE